MAAYLDHAAQNNLHLFAVCVLLHDCLLLLGMVPRTLHLTMLRKAADERLAYFLTNWQGGASSLRLKVHCNEGERLSTSSPFILLQLQTDRLSRSEPFTIWHLQNRTLQNELRYPLRTYMYIPVVVPQRHCTQTLVRRRRRVCISDGYA